MALLKTANAHILKVDIVAAETQINKEKFKAAGCRALNKLIPQDGATSSLTQNALWWLLFD